MLSDPHTRGLQHPKAPHASPFLLQKLSPEISGAQPAVLDGNEPTAKRGANRIRRLR